MTNFLIMNLIFFMLYIMMNYYINFLNFLISIEYLILMILYYMIEINLNNWIFLIYLIYSVCESVLGLSLMVSMNFEYGHQKIYIMNLY
uniref:NADH dehydrogenase subunit 4L n=1 Tax=Bombus sylvestris TaxID=30201 RepID=A0A0S2LT52_BOMSL|nr:NADH dehydrogenase subunit 4L [Bombus sylvestris]